MSPLSSAPARTVRCPDPHLRAALESWLDASGLEWPGTLELRAQVVESLPERDDSREILTQPELEIQAGPPDGTVRIRWTGPEAEAIVHPTAPHATILFTPAAVADLEPAERGFLLVVLLFMLRRVGWYHTHCAALNDPAGDGWLFVGHSRSGKSTTSALLARNGWRVSTDDIGFLVAGAGGVGVHGYRSTIALRDGGLALLNAEGGVDHSRRGKSGFHPEALGTEWIGVVHPRRIVFPTIGDATTFEPMTGREVINALIASSMWVLFEPVHAQEHLDLLSRLAAQSQSYRATFGPDLIANPSMLLEHLS